MLIGQTLACFYMSTTYKKKKTGIKGKKSFILSTDAVIRRSFMYLEVFFVGKIT